MMKSLKIESNNLTQKFIGYANQQKQGYKRKNQFSNRIDQFTAQTSEIAMKINHIISLVDQCQKIQSKATLFNSKDQEISLLISEIQKNIEQQSSQLTQLDKNKENYMTQITNTKEIMCSTIISILTDRFLTIKKQFKEILEKQTKVIKKNESKKSTKRKKLISNQNQPLFLTVDETKQRFITNQQSTNNTNNFDNQETNNNDIHIAMDQTYMQNQNNLKQMGYIEQLIQGVGKNFEKLGHIVAFQEGLINRIDNETYEAQKLVKGGRKVLTETYEDVTSNRKLILTIFALLLVFSAIYIIFT